ncbi:hypothetical protein FDECE_18102 [Fusarium decemcellulare]|nr:hypothetical protein FDECE_18102 [Fusarium decemcellulare]
MDSSREAHNMWAVLIGVDYYIKGTSRREVNFHRLKGCVEDVKQVKKYLHGSLGMPESNITQLTATAPADDEGSPLEDASNWPTYENIVHALEEVTNKANVKDVVYVHYSGHGIRAGTIFEDLKGADALDEALVPTNIANEGRYIRDVEIAYLLLQMVQKGLIVTVVLDCCHSGGANRGPRDSKGDLIRGIDTIDRHNLKTDKSDFPKEKLSEVMSSSAEDQWRRSSVRDHWLIGSSGYMFLAACQAHEGARECRFNDRSQGLLTHSLLETLKCNPHPITYHHLWTLVKAKVAERGAQHVVLGGEASRLFCSSDSWQIFNGATVTEVSRTSGGSITAKINAGVIHGITTGTILDVWPALCSSRSRDERLGELSVEKTTDLASETRLTKAFNSERQLEVGCLALPYSDAKLQQPVRLVRRPDLTEPGLHNELLQLLHSAWARFGTPFAPLIGAEADRETFQVRAEGGNFVISDSNGEPLQHAIPYLRTNGYNAPERLVRRLTHLAKYYNVRGLADDHAKTPRAPLIMVELTKKRHSFPESPRKAINPSIPISQARSCEASSQEWVLLRVTNISNFVLNITVLDLDSEWGITQAYPNPPVSSETLDPKYSLYLPLEVQVPEGVMQSDTLDTLLVFATREPTSFRWLELPRLDGEDPNRTGHRQEPRNALERLMAALTRYENVTRKAVWWVPWAWTVQSATLTKSIIP